MDFHHAKAILPGQEPGTQLSWGDQDGPEIFKVDLSVFVLTPGLGKTARQSWVLAFLVSSVVPSIIFPTTFSSHSPVFPRIGSMSTAFIAHYNAPKCLDEVAGLLWPTGFPKCKCSPTQ